MHTERGRGEGMGRKPHVPPQKTSNLITKMQKTTKIKEPPSCLTSTSTLMKIIWNQLCIYAYARIKSNNDYQKLSQYGITLAKFEQIWAHSHSLFQTQFYKGGWLPVARHTAASSAAFDQNVIWNDVRVRVIWKS
jgi:hypothetical protein